MLDFRSLIIARYVQQILGCQAQVTFPASLGGSGRTYTDDGTNYNMDNGGHRDNWNLLMTDVLDVTDFAVEQTSLTTAQHSLAAASAATAASAPGTSATSSTSDTVASGSTTITIETGKSIVVGMSVKIARTSDPTIWMHGDVTAYNSGNGSLTVNVTATQGSGTYSDWTVSLSGPTGLPSVSGNENNILQVVGSAASWQPNTGLIMINFYSGTT